MADAGDDQGKSFAEERDSVLRIALAPLIWAGHFVLVYAATSVVCVKLVEHATAFAWLRIGIGAVTVLALAAIATVGWRSWRQWDFLDDYDYVHDKAVEEHRHEFLGHAAFLLAVISFIGVAYVAMPTAFVRSCT